MKTLAIDGKRVQIARTERVPNFPNLVRVFVADEQGRAVSQHDIPPSGKFRTGGHLYEWGQQ